MAGWGSWRALQARWENLDESTADHVAQFTCGEKVDVQPGLGAAEVVDGEAAVAVILEVVMIGVDVRVWGIDADAKQASGRDACRRRTQMLACLRSSAMLEDLDSDDDFVLSEIR